MTMTARKRRQRGVSLIEALVALAVMAFGMLGVVGMQTSLRSNADLSRQRAEAVRIAQEEVERLRGFGVLQASEAASGQLAFESIAAVASAPVAASNANTTFDRQTFVATPSADDPRIRHVRVRVGWTDRRAQDQSVELSSLIAGVPPAVAALHAMRTDQTAMGLPYGRNASIPPSAVPGETAGTSSFTPPGSPAVRWIFNDRTGLITQICNPPGTCTATNRWLLSGIVAFATGAAPAASEAESPSDPVVSLTMSVDRSREGYLPFSTTLLACATETVGADRIRYYCAMPTTLLDAGAPTQRVWSGRVRFGGLALATSLADATATSYKICRYTPDENQYQDASEVLAAGLSYDVYNGRNPYAFIRVNGPQQNKNFLVISAGDGTTAFGCPDENTGPLIQSNTWPHEPIS